MFIEIIKLEGSRGCAECFHNDPDSRWKQNVLKIQTEQFSRQSIQLCPDHMHQLYMQLKEKLDEVAKG